MLHPPSTPSNAVTDTVTVIFETPETVALALRSAHSLGNTELVDLYLQALHEAHAAAVDSVRPRWTVQQSELHMAPRHDPSIPQPHVHVSVSGIEHPDVARAWALAAHERFQGALRRGLPGALVDQPGGVGWEIKALVPMRGRIGRHLCLPPSPTVLYPADLAAPRTPPAATRIA